MISRVRCRLAHLLRHQREFPMPERALGRLHAAGFQPKAILNAEQAMDCLRPRRGGIGLMPQSVALSQSKLDPRHSCLHC